MINIGDWVKTSYGTGPYKIIKIIKDCICSDFVDSINMENPPNRVKHIHLSCDDVKGRSGYVLNGYDEKTLVSIKETSSKKADYLIKIEKGDRELDGAVDLPVQIGLF